MMSGKSHEQFAAGQLTYRDIASANITLVNAPEV